MNDTLTIRGLPRALAMDGWWLAPEGSGGGTGTSPADTREARRIPHAAGLLLLVAAADLLFWRHGPGISAAIFGLLVFAVAVWQGRLHGWTSPALLAIAGALPVVDLVQPLSMLFLVASLTVALIWAHHPDASPAAVGRSASAFALRLPRRWLAQLDPRRFGIRSRIGQTNGQRYRHMLRNWAFPIGGCLVFTSLLMDANPVLARAFEIDLDFWSALERGLFWAGIAILVAPFLEPSAPPPGAQPIRWTLPTAWLGIHAGSVLRALVAFNLLIGVQSVTDLSILIAGAELPQGMTFAEYAHRGAYPLLATAMLAGGFALLARPFVGEHRTIRPLMLLWLGQNMVLCAAAALRLDLYVGAFGLTYLRVHAFIWMGLVAAGLGLMFWQVLRAHGNGWLLLRLGGLGVATLYLCSFVNFAEIIAAQNVTRENPDRDYLCSLGPLAARPLVESGVGKVTRAGNINLDACYMLNPKPGNWREWGFRRWAASRYLVGTKTGELPDDHPDRG